MGNLALRLCSKPLLAGNSRLLCTALLLGRSRVDEMAQCLLESTEDLNELSSVDYTMEEKG